MTPSSQPSSGATEGYLSYGLLWLAYDFRQGGYGGHQMFPPQQITGHGPSSPGAPRVPPAPTGNNPVIRPTSSASTAPGQLSSAPGRPPLASQRNDFSRLGNRAGQMLPGLAICPHCERFSMTNTIQNMRGTIRRTCAGPKAKPQSA